MVGTAGKPAWSELPAPRPRQEPRQRVAASRWKGA